MIEIIDKGQCSGCSACVNICNFNAIEMQYDEYGIAYPVVGKGLCVDCHSCEGACPYNNLNILPKQEEKFYPPIYACYNKDENIRMRSTSGGIFSLLAEYILKNGGVVFAAYFDKQLRVIHSKAKNFDEIGQFRGSKYVQSDIGFTYREIKSELNNNNKVLFVGTPCQAVGLNQYLKKNHENLYICDFICMGIASPKIWEFYLCHYERHKDIKAFVFKDKKNGWHNWKIKIVYPNKTKYINRNNNPFMYGYLKHLYYRPSCFECPFKGIRRISDFTMADCWGIDKIDPAFDDDRGATTLIVQSEKAVRIFEEIKGNLAYRSMTADDVMTYNKYSRISVSRNDEIELFQKDIKKKGFKYAMKKHCSNKRLSVKKIANKIKTILSTR